MPRKPKTQSAPAAAAAVGNPAEPSAVAPEGIRKVAKKSNSRRTAAKKSTGTRSKRKPADSPQPTERRQPTDDEIRLRAYFIAERRVQMGIPGSEDDDWMEARRQLEAELNW